jgi:DNA-binding transcriptional regulator/RsmH inhibitor MraZ
VLSFCGQDRCSVDANGRIKLSPKVATDFAAKCGGQVVMHCLPEGAIAVYPEEIYLEMRRQETLPAAKAANSMVFRRSMRRFGALSSPESISNQGRITLPQAFREYAATAAGSEVWVVGVEIGIEIWNAERWAEELDKMNEHAREKGEREMAADLTSGDNIE